MVGMSVQPFNGKPMKTARSHGKKFRVTVEKETCRILGNLGWAYMQLSKDPGERKNMEPNQYLQLDVKGCKDVYASFDKYVEVERLEGYDKYQAEGHDLQINDRYEFPLQLDLDRENGKYLSPDADKSVRNLYTLHSVLVHSGGVHGGHYYAFIRPTLSDQCHCGDVEILYPFGIGKGCYLEKSYEIQCPNTTSSGRQIPFLSAIGKEVVYISLPTEETFLSSQSSDIVHYLTYGLVRVKTPIISAGCLAGGEEFIESIMNFTGEDQPSNNIPFLDKAGCSSKKLSYRSYEGCTVNRPEEAECDGNGCCQVSLPNDPQQAIGIRIESNDGNSTTRTREEHCRVAFITDEVYTLYNATKPRQLFGKKYATFTLRWVIQTKNHSFLSSLRCANIKDNGHTSNSIGPQLKCLCDQSNISEITYVHCGCKKGFTDVNECQTLSYPPCRKGETCVNTQGDYDCVGDKKKPILIGVGSGFGVLVLVGGVWWLRKFLIKRRVTKRKKKFFKRNGGLLLQQELNTKEGNVEKTRIFSLRELEKATENFSQNRVLGHGEVPMLVYEFIINGNLFQHIQEESDDYTMVQLAELITGDKPVIMVQNTREIVSLADHFRIAMKENRLSNIMDARIKDDCKPEQVMAVANLALKCLKVKKRPNMRQVFMELERICTSPEGLQEQNRNNEEGQEEEEEEDVNMINKEVSWSVSVTAPAVCTVASPSSSDVEPLFPRLTW
ncbi:hypothetical protein Bca101_079709 [Brassica carinata]